MNLKKSVISLCALLCSAFFVKAPASEIKIEAVSNFDLARYLGKWYEIARLPASFEKDMVKVTATYTLKANGTVRVQNEGLKKGEHETAIGKAKFATKDKTAGYLKVSFFGPFYADYKVVALDTASYGYAMVASSKKYLWILCRQPVLDPAVLQSLVKSAADAGFPVDKLYYTPQQ